MVAIIKDNLLKYYHCECITKEQKAKIYENQMYIELYYADAYIISFCICIILMGNTHIVNIYIRLTILITIIIIIQTN